MTSPRLVHDKASLRAACDDARRAGKRVGLVPTMGALHAGHRSLMKHAAEQADFIVVTIFVNPLQFAPTDDLDRYPRTLDADLRACGEMGVHLVFAPEPGSMYPPGFQTEVRVTEVTRPLEGEHRPDHFDGVTTVVTKLFNLVGACKAVFGRKDYQQWRTLSRLAEDLDMPVEVIGRPIVREADGLALSSRNRYLSADERVRALGLCRGLRAADALWRDGERDIAVLERAARGPVDDAFDRVDYVAMVDPDTLEPPEGAPDRLMVLMAAHLGSTRLIDNFVLGQDEPL